MAITIVVKRGGCAFLYVPGATFLNVYFEDDVMDTHVRRGTVPLDMPKIPPWINRSKVDANGVLAMAMLWLECQRGRADWDAFRAEEEESDGSL